MSDNQILAALTRIDQRLDGLEQGQKQVDQRLGGVEQGQKQLEQRLDGLEQGQKQVDQRLGGVEQGQRDLVALVGRVQAEATRNRSDIMARMDRFQDAVTAIRDDIAVNFGTADQVRRANDNTREGLRVLGDVVATMQKQIQRLQTEVRELRGDP